LVSPAVSMEITRIHFFKDQDLWMNLLNGNNNKLNFFWSQSVPLLQIKLDLFDFFPFYNLRWLYSQLSRQSRILCLLRIVMVSHFTEKKPPSILKLFGLALSQDNNNSSGTILRVFAIKYIYFSFVQEDIKEFFDQ